MTERIRTLPDAELAVMQAVWACEAPAKRAQLAAILDKTHPMAPTTLLTVLSRLADKGFLQIEKTGRSAEYWPLVAREDYLARQGRKFYDTLCGGSLPAFAAALCASGLTAQELAELRLENPELSLKELGELLHPPIGRSGVNHRFQKLSMMAKELREYAGTEK